MIDVSKYSRKTVIKNGRQKYHMDTAAINRDALIKAGLLPGLLFAGFARFRAAC